MKMWTNLSMTCNGIEIEVIRKAVRRVSLKVSAGGKVQLNVPWFTPMSVAEAFVRDKAGWIEANYLKFKDKTPRTLQPVSREEKAELLRFLDPCVRHWLDIMQEERPVQCRLRNMKSMWGNCRAETRVITFSLQLAHKSDAFREYIVVHELCHLKVQNHGPAFKALMDRYLPDWRERKKEGKN